VPTNPKAPGKYRKPDPAPDDGVMFTVDEDGRGPKWPYGSALRCIHSSKQRTNEARKQGLIGPTEIRRCRKPVAYEGAKRCKRHGGSVGSKKLSPKLGRPIKHGRYSRGAGILRAHYEASLGDQSLYDLREGLAVMDSVVKRSLERIGELDTADFRARALKLYNEAQDAPSSGDAVAAQLKLRELGELLEQGGEEDKALNLLTNSVSTMQRRVEEAWKIKLMRDETMNVRDLVGTLGQMVEIVFQVCGEKAGNEVAARIDSMIRSFAPNGAGGSWATKSYNETKRRLEGGGKVVDAESTTD